MHPSTILTTLLTLTSTLAIPVKRADTCKGKLSGMTIASCMYWDIKEYQKCIKNTCPELFDDGE